MNRRTSRLLFVLVGVVLCLSTGTTPTGAIETESFGLDVAERSEDGRLHLALRAGDTTTGKVKVWNKRSEPTVLQLSVVPAQIDGSGTVSLGGDGAGVDWVTLERTEVELAGNAERVIEVRAKAPRKLDDRVLAVAIQVEPGRAVDAAQPAVVQRLALTTYLEPDEDSLIASLGPFPWIALGGLAVVVTALVRNALRRRRAGIAPPAP